VSNPAYSGVDPLGYTTGRGSVGYEFNIGRYEVTSAQWVEFYNAALNRADPIPWVQTPVFWGGTRNSPSGPFTVRTGGDMLPAGGMTWRTCAILCNWLTNGKSTDRTAFMSGAYAVSTFGEDGQGGFTDQLTHSPGATYWIPTRDEWLKAAHYDPHKHNSDGTIGGWWLYNTTSDTAPVYGPPPGFTNGSPLNQANAGFSLPGNREFSIPLGAYTNVTSPWGLYDTAGATGEWLEEAAGRIGRFAEGSAWSGGVGGDLIWSAAGGYPGDASFSYGMRLAHVIPAPSSLIVIGACGTFGIGRRGGTGRMGD